jgi:hypothetical protein
VNDWETDTVSLDWLTEAALSETASGYDRAFPWLIAIGLLPSDIALVKIIGGLKIRAFRCEAIPVRYLAASAQEWDAWGSSDPVDFVQAIGVECVGTLGHAAVVGLLSDLGHEDDDLDDEEAA